MPMMPIVVMVPNIHASLLVSPIASPVFGLSGWRTGSFFVKPPYFRLKKKYATGPLNRASMPPTK